MMLIEKVKEIQEMCKIKVDLKWGESEFLDYNPVAKKDVVDLCETMLSMHKEMIELQDNVSKLNTDLTFYRDEYTSLKRKNSILLLSNKQKEDIILNLLMNGGN